MSRKIRMQELIKNAREEGFVNGSVTCAINIMIDILKHFPINIQIKILAKVAQWHKTQEDKPEGGTKEKSSKIELIH